MCVCVTSASLYIVDYGLKQQRSEWDGKRVKTDIALIYGTAVWLFPTFYQVNKSGIQADGWTV